MEKVLLYSVTLFVITFAGGSLPLWKQRWKDAWMKYLLGFSGAFLLGITLLHLVPENIEHYGRKAGILILAGFFLQQIIQKYTHGVEHGHIHTHHDGVPIAVMPVFVGLGVHAFSEGLPLGILYEDPATLSSLYMAVALHKLPEAMLVGSLASYTAHSKNKAFLLVLLFAAITPLASLLSCYAGAHSHAIATVVEFCIPIVAGSFIHIATTIFFESGTKAHEMNWKKWLAILSGLGLALLTLLGGDAH